LVNNKKTQFDVNFFDEAHCFFVFSDDCDDCGEDNGYECKIVDVRFDGSHRCMCILTDLGEWVSECVVDDNLR
jgi:hypothetical protein